MELFRALAANGAELVALHLLESPKLDDFLTDWAVKGDNVVENVRYSEKGGRVWINKTQYFGGVPQAVWEFHVGGYQVCDKWLKDRKGRKLAYEDTQHYQKIVVAVSETIRRMVTIDEIIDQKGWPIRKPVSPKRLLHVLEEGVDELVGLEQREILGLLADADVLHGQPDRLANGDHDAALGRAVELGQQQAGAAHGVGEMPGLADAVLAGGGVEDQEHFVRGVGDLLAQHAMDLGQLLHQALLGLQAAGRVDDADVGAGLAGPGRPHNAPRWPDRCRRRR